MFSKIFVVGIFLRNAKHFGNFSFFAVRGFATLPGAISLSAKMQK
jgi:hypothetical protein